MKRKAMILLFLLFPLLALSCESFIFYPDSNVYVDPPYIGRYPEEIFLNTIDGEILHGWLFRAKDSVPSRRNVIVQFHGNGMNMTAHFMSLLWMTDIGYDLFTFDYRGYGLSSGEPSREGLHTDALTVLNYARSRFSKEKKKLIVFGQSLGGAVAMRAVGEMREQLPLTAVVVDGTFASYKSVSYQTMSGLLFPLRLIVLLWVDDDYSPKDWIPKIYPIPLIVVHGDQDDVIPFENGQAVYNLAKNPRVFFHIHNGGHGGWMQQGQSPAAEKFINLLDRIVAYDQGLSK